MNIQYLKNSLFVSLLSLIFLTSCSDEVLPKPTGFLRLEYPSGTYKISTTTPYEFETSTTANVLLNAKHWMKIKYPTLNATIDITYRPVDNNIKELLFESELLTTKHATKADAIYFENFENKDDSVFGKLSNVTGNAASPLQFHLTDSTKHFLTGALYFNVPPNYDSIYPAIKYIEKDLKHLMNTTKWHE